MATIDEDTERLRANSYLRIDYQISDRFSSGFQLESYAPEPLLNYSRLFDEEIGLGTFYLNYRTKKLDLSPLGITMLQFGSGLILRAWEDRALRRQTTLLEVVKLFTTLQAI